MNRDEQIRVVLVVKDKEPEIVTINHGLSCYNELISKNLSNKERSISDVNGLDFFSPNVNRVSGVVEEYSACHPYDRNRDWHGPAVFFEFDSNGSTISMSDEKAEELKKIYSLSNTTRSTSDKINNFLGKYHTKPVMFNFHQGNFQATANTMDYADMILAERREGAIKDIELIFDEMTEMSSKTGELIETLLTEYLIDLGKAVLTQQAKASPIFSACK